MHNLNESLGEDQPKVENNIYFILCFRWFAVVVVISYFLLSKSNVSQNSFLVSAAASVIYNIAVTIFSLRNIYGIRKNNFLALYIDVIFTSVFIYQLGGIDSDVYTCYFFLIGFCGVTNSINHTVNIGILSIILYTIATIIHSINYISDFSFWRLTIKDLFIAFAFYCITLINHELQKYDEMHKKEFRLARMDKLTGLANRHFFDQKLKEEVNYSNMTGMPLNVIMFDIDNFKKFNDTYGHLWGDKLLAMFSEIIKQNIRKTDIPVRYGGEEFLILIRDLEEDMARCVAERIRKQLEKLKIYIGNDDERKKVTVSCGLAQYPADSKDIKEVIELADKALYHAKETGKNMVVSFNELKQFIGR